VRSDDCCGLFDSCGRNELMVIAAPAGYPGSHLADGQAISAEQVTLGPLRSLASGQAAPRFAQCPLCLRLQPN
jgi:hypothetical protein